MNTKLVSRIISLVLLIEAAFMIVPVLICLFEGNTKSMLAFIYTIIIICAITLPFAFFVKNKNRQFYLQEGFVTTGLSWICMSFFGSLPLFISGEVKSFTDSFFEIVSGFTTTGASVVSDVEAMSRGMLYWRSFTHWLGGMGVLVFLLAVIPAVTKDSGAGSDMHIMRAESPGPEVDKLTPHIRKTALILYEIYFSMTVICFIMLLLGGMPAFDSLCIAFGTAGTGGFGVLNSSMASYGTYCQVVVIVFMILFGVNFFVYYSIMKRDFKSVLKNRELRVYLIIYLAASLIMVIDTRGMFNSVGETVKNSFFQAASIMTTTGYNTFNLDTVPTLTRTVYLLLMCVGACAGSTAGGLKVSRIVILIKGICRSLRTSISPNRVQIVSVDGRKVDERVVTSVLSYLGFYCLIIAASVFLIAFDGFSTMTNISAVLSCLNNIGPVFGSVPTNSFASFSVLSKLVLSFDMLLGRLEIFPLLVLASRLTWKRNR